MTDKSKDDAALPPELQVRVDVYVRKQLAEQFDRLWNMAKVIGGLAFAVIAFFGLKSSWEMTTARKEVAEVIAAMRHQKVEYDNVVQNAKREVAKAQAEVSALLLSAKTSVAKGQTEVTNSVLNARNEVASLTKEAGESKRFFSDSKQSVHNAMTELNLANNKLTEQMAARKRELEEGINSLIPPLVKKLQEIPDGELGKLVQDALKTLPTKVTLAADWVEKHGSDSTYAANWVKENEAVFAAKMHWIATRQDAIDKFPDDIARIREEALAIEKYAQDLANGRSPFTKLLIKHGEQKSELSMSNGTLVFNGGNGDRREWQIQFAADKEKRLSRIGLFEIGSRDIVVDRNKSVQSY